MLGPLPLKRLACCRLGAGGGQDDDWYLAGRLLLILQNLAVLPGGQVPQPGALVALGHARLHRQAVAAHLDGGARLAQQVQEPVWLAGPSPVRRYHKVTGSVAVVGERGGARLAGAAAGGGEQQDGLATQPAAQATAAGAHQEGVETREKLDRPVHGRQV